MRHLLLIVWCWMSGAVFAQQPTPIKADRSPPRIFLVEIAPLLSFVNPANELAGPVGIATSLEGAVTPQWHLGALLAYTSLTRKPAVVDAAKKVADNTEPIGKSLQGFTLVFDSKYLMTPSAHSWFLGLGVGVSRGDIQYAYRDSTTATHFSEMFFTGECGYRWLWNRFSLRVTGRGNSKFYDQTNVAFPTRTLALAQSRLPPNKSPELLPNLQLGVGYTF